ncbi:DUF6344 domain-containing protein [Streptomyces sp. NPDC048442]|uniref:DUF6344 domain-containing protein n=1 Tax=Streptomyces sp. NPDC048442 TaxID=3154823 RepID=UPI00341E0574
MKTMWTALISAIVALLAMLGFAAPAAATAPAATADNSSDAQQSAAPAGARHLPGAERPAGAPLSARWSAELPTRAVPPTMKQRIRAEAHGGSPSVRQVPALDRAQGVRAQGDRADYETAA